jgi:predicted RNA-binding protein Jag
MKIIIRSVVLAVIGGLIILIIMTVGGRMNRSMELEGSVPSAVEETVAGRLRQNSTVDTRQEYLSQFVEEICYSMDTDADIQVKVAGVDTEKGLLSVNVTECFKNPNGNAATVSVERTSLLNWLPEDNP